MDINDRIQKIGEYFKVFNVNNGAVCVGVVFPEKWILFDIDTICNEFGVQIQEKNGTIYFLCPISDGFDPVFDAVDFIIEQNIALEEKTSLLKEKAEELRSLFEKEPLEKLKTLHFVFDTTDDIVNLDGVTIPIDIKQELKKNVKTVNVSETKTENIVGEEIETKPKQQKKPRKKNNNDSSLMNFVKDNLENE